MGLGCFPQGVRGRQWSNIFKHIGDRSLAIENLHAIHRFRLFNAERVTSAPGGMGAVVLLKQLSDHLVVILADQRSIYRLSDVLPQMLRRMCGEPTIASNVAWIERLIVSLIGGDVFRLQHFDLGNSFSKLIHLVHGFP